MENQRLLVEIIAWILSLGCVGWRVIPLFLYVCNFSRYSTAADDPSQDVMLCHTDPFAEAVHRQLIAGHFQPLGSFTERRYFFGIEWENRLAFQVFSLADESCFACLYRLAPGEPIRLSLATVFADGAVVWTSNHGSETLTEESDYVRQNIVSNDLAAVLQRHREVVSQFHHDGRQLVQATSLDPLLNAGKRLAHRDYRLGKRNGLAWLVPVAFWLILLPLCVGAMTKFAGLGILMASLTGIFMMAHQQRLAYRSLAQLRTREVGKNTGKLTPRPKEVDSTESSGDTSIREAK